jgi:hypothetical protein
MFSMLFNLFKVFGDAPVAWQMWFQDPATSVMEGGGDVRTRAIVGFVQAQERLDYTQKGSQTQSMQV